METVMFTKGKCKGKCSNCGKWGHKAADCRSKKKYQNDGKKDNNNDGDRNNNTNDKVKRYMAKI